MLLKPETSKQLEEIYSNYNIKHSPCKLCNSAIFYPHTLISIDSSKTVKLLHANYSTYKIFNNKKYQLEICYFCLSKEFPEIKLKSSNKLFNTCNKYVKFAFNVNDEDYKNKRKDHGVTLTKLITKYGINRGTAKWEKYCSFQKEKNTFEYKKKEYNFTKSQFNEFNKSRGVTKNNLIKKYGDSDGLIKWNNYVERQRFTKSLDYYIHKYGDIDGPLKFNSVNLSKGLTLSNFINKYGEEIGTIKFKEYLNHAVSPVSKVSQCFFKELDDILSPFNLKTYYFSKNTEFSVLLKSVNKYYKLDYYIYELRLAIEYNGDYWHANPKIYKNTDVLHSNMTASEIWDRDNNRILNLFNEKQIETIQVWQNDDFINRQTLLTKIYDTIKNRISKNKIN